MDQGRKKVLRDDYLDKRNALSEGEILQFNNELLKEFKKLSLEEIHFLHFFLPIQKFREPDTHPIIHWLLKHHPEIKIVLSRSNLETHLMEHFIWDGSQELFTNRWGIEEPDSGTKVLPQQLDAVIVPLLVFDKKGNRVGFGKGFYDRFLVDCRPDCLKIGLSFFEPIEKILDIDAHDIQLDVCISRDTIWRFNSFNKLA